MGNDWVKHVKHLEMEGRLRKIWDEVLMKNLEHKGLDRQNAHNCCLGELPSDDKSLTHVNMETSFQNNDEADSIM